MTTEKEYYTEALKTFRQRVHQCSRDSLSSLVFFMEEANTHSTGISNDVIKEIKDEVVKFNKNCGCGRIT